jgi:hypothetical protein
MNAVSASSWRRSALEGLGTVAPLALWTLWRILRVALFAVLAVFEPVVRYVLSIAALGLFLTTALFFFAGPHGLNVSYGILLALALGFAVVLVLYEALLRALAP